METDAFAYLNPDQPKRIGCYDAFLHIGSGGMARLFLGVQRGPFDVKRLVAMKQLRREIAEDPDALDCFVREAQIAMRLNHPNVVHTYEVLVEGSQCYLIMEFLDGQSMHDILRRVGRLSMPLHEHVWILTELLKGLQYSHELRDFDGTPLQLVHRDVTPSNVFVCHNGEVKLLDFGIATTKGTAKTTRSSTQTGKLGYLAPEQCRGEPATARSDIYAVGVMLWEAMARKRRLWGATEAEQLRTRAQGEEPSIERVWPGAPPMLASCANRALQLDPARRYATAQEFRRDLEHFLMREQSEACAESVSRLLQPHFERDRIVRRRAIKMQLGVRDSRELGDALALVTQSNRVASPAPEEELDATSAALDLDHRTSRIPVDRALLQASRRHPVITPREGAAGVVRDVWTRIAARLGSLTPRLEWKRWRLRAGLTVAALLALGVATAALWIRDEPVADRPTTSLSPAQNVPTHTHEAGAAKPEEAPPPPAPQPTATALPRVESADPPIQPTQLAPKPRSRWRRVTARADKNPVDPPQADQVEPGMDFPPVARTSHENAIDREDPYEP